MPRSSTDPKGGWSQLPLPGTHTMITWQLNLTWHYATRSVKWTSVLRDPNEQVELARVGLPLSEEVEGVQGAIEHVPHVVEQLSYLGGRPTGLWTPAATQG